MGRSLASTEKKKTTTFKTTTVLSTDLNSTENYTSAPDELIKKLTQAQMFYKYFNHVHFFICNFILINVKQVRILFYAFYFTNYVRYLLCVSTALSVLQILMHLTS